MPKKKGKNRGGIENLHQKEHNFKASSINSEPRSTSHDNRGGRNSKPAKAKRDLNAKPEDERRDLNAKPEDERRDLDAKPEGERRDLKAKPEGERRDLNAKSIDEKHNFNPQTVGRGTEPQPEVTTDVEGSTPPRASKAARAPEPKPDERNLHVEKQQRDFLERTDSSGDTQEEPEEPLIEETPKVSKLNEKTEEEKTNQEKTSTKEETKEETKKEIKEEVKKQEEIDAKASKEQEETEKARIKKEEKLDRKKRKEDEIEETKQEIKRAEEEAEIDRNNREMQEVEKKAPKGLPDDAYRSDYATVGYAEMMAENHYDAAERERYASIAEKMRAEQQADREKAQNHSDAAEREKYARKVEDTAQAEQQFEQRKSFHVQELQDESKQPNRRELSDERRKREREANEEASRKQQAYASAAPQTTAPQTTASLDDLSDKQYHVPTSSTYDADDALQQAYARGIAEKTAQQKEIAERNKGRATSTQGSFATQGTPRERSLGTPEDLMKLGLTGKQAKTGPKTGKRAAGSFAQRQAFAMGKNLVRGMEGDGENNPHLMSGAISTVEKGMTVRRLYREVRKLKATQGILGKYKAWDARNKAEFARVNGERYKRFQNLSARQKEIIKSVQNGQARMRNAAPLLRRIQQEKLDIIRHGGAFTKINEIRLQGVIRTAKEWTDKGKQQFRYTQSRLKEANKQAKAIRDANKARPRIKTSPATFKENLDKRIKTAKASIVAVNTGIKTAKATIKTIMTADNKVLAIKTAVRKLRFVGGGKRSPLIPMNLQFFGKSGGAMDAIGLFNAGRAAFAGGGRNTQHGQADDYGSAFQKKPGERSAIGKALDTVETTWRTGRRFKRVIHHARKGYARAKTGVKAFNQARNTYGTIRTVKGLAMKMMKALPMHPAQAAMQLAMLLGKKLLGKLADLKMWLGEVGAKFAKGVFNATIAILLIIPMLTTTTIGKKEENKADGSTPVTPWGLLLAAGAMAVALGVAGGAMAISAAGQKRIQRESDINTILDAYMRAPITGGVCVGRCIDGPPAGRCANPGASGQDLYEQMMAIELVPDMIPASDQPRYIFRRMHQADPIELKNYGVGRSRSRADLLAHLRMDHPPEACEDLNGTDAGDDGGNDDIDWTADFDAVEGSNGICSEEAYHILLSGQVKMSWLRQRARELEKERNEMIAGANEVVLKIEPFLNGTVTGNSTFSFPAKYNGIVNIARGSNLHALDVIGIAAYMHHDNDGFPVWEGRAGSDGIRIPLVGWTFGAREPEGLQYYVSRLFASGVNDHGMYGGNLVSVNQTFEGVQVEHDHEYCTQDEDGNYCHDPVVLHTCTRTAYAVISDNLDLRPLHDAWPFEMHELNQPIVKNEIDHVQEALDDGGGGDPDCEPLYDVGTYTDSEAKQIGIEAHPHYSVGSPSVNTITVANGGGDTCSLTGGKILETTSDRISDYTINFNRVFDRYTVQQEIIYSDDRRNTTIIERMSGNRREVNFGLDENDVRLHESTGYLLVRSGHMLDTREGWYKIFRFYGQEQVAGTPPVIYKGYENILYLATPYMRMYYPPDNSGGHWVPDPDNDDLTGSDLLIQNFPYTFYNRGVYIYRAAHDNSIRLFETVPLAGYGKRGVGRKESDQEIFRSKDHSQTVTDADGIEKAVFDGFFENDIFTALRDREELFKFHFPLIDNPVYQFDLNSINSTFYDFNNPWEGNSGWAIGSGGSNIQGLPSLDSLGLSNEERAILEEAIRHLGTPYIWGGNGSNNSWNGFDCSGFVYYVFNRTGVASFGRTNTGGLRGISTPVSPANLRPGDLVNFDGHVGIYYGQCTVTGRPIMIDAGGGDSSTTSPTSGAQVRYTYFDTAYWQGRFISYSRLQ